MLPDMELWNGISYRILGCCFQVHRHLGPGLLESVYDDALAMEMTMQGLVFERQKPVPVQYKDEAVGDALRLDFLVEDTVVVEVKAVEELHKVHGTQVLTYLKLTKKPLGLLVNFNTTSLRHGIKRIIQTSHLVE